MQLCILLLCAVVVLQWNALVQTTILEHRATDNRSPGETYPDQVEIAIGESVNISCTINLAVFPGRTVDDLLFINWTTHQPVPKSDIEKVNATTILYMLRNATEQQSKYLCKCGTDAIMFTKVYVGAPPRTVSDFACHSYDFEYMECNFTKPYNPVLTRYNLSLHLDSPDYNYWPECNYENSTVVCKASITRNVEHFHFKLRSINTLGKREQLFNINNFNVMVPAAPGENFNVTEFTTDTFEFEWRMPKLEWYLAKGLQWEVLLQPDNLQEMDLSTMTQPVRLRSELRSRHELRSRNYDYDFRLRLKDLPYAFYWYTLSLRVKLRTAAVWSAPFVHRFQTTACIPDRAPRTNVGSFYIDSTETHVRLYWEQLRPFEYNGHNFSYVIDEVSRNNRIIQVKPEKLEMNSAIFAWDKSSHYLFGIRSRNHLGESRKSSFIEIYPLRNRDTKLFAPRAIHNVYDATNRTYTLTWDAPIIRDDLLNYTVYWCFSKRALQNECKGSIHFKEISSYIHKFTTEPQSMHQEHTLNLAVSANYIDYNSGMHWTTCTLDVNSDLVRMEPQVDPLNSTTLKVEWSQSVCPSILLGYNLSYCEIANSVNSTCVNSPILTVVNKNDKKREISNLKPYTFYKIEMFMYSAHKEGKISDFVYGRTLESAPTPPRLLQKLLVTNTSARISWLPPSESNGEIRYYTVFLNNKQYRVKPNVASNQSARIFYEFQNLTSFTHYKAYVTAQTVEGSDASNDIHFMTLIGYPSKPGSAIPVVDTDNGTVIQWSKPDMPAGLVDFYEVEVKQMRRDELIGNRISIIANNTRCTLKIPACIDHEYRTTVDVRAVNVVPLRADSNAIATDHQFLSDDVDVDEGTLYAGNDELLCLVDGKQNAYAQDYINKTAYRYYKSDWQRGTTYGCSANRLSRITTIALIAVLMSVSVMVVLYMARKKYNKMANIDCKLPPGLAAYITKDGLPADFITADKDEDVQQFPRNIFNNEKHRLLAPVAGSANCLGYLTEARVFCGSVETATIDDPHSIPVDHVRHDSESYADSLTEGSNNSDPDAMDMEIRGHIQNSGVEELLESNAYIKPSAVPPQLTTPQDIIPEYDAQSSYIKPSSMRHLEDEQTPIEHSNYTAINSIGNVVGKHSHPPATFFNGNAGYVQPSAIQKFGSTVPATIPGESFQMNFSGYTTLENLGKIGALTGTSPGMAVNGIGNGAPAAFTPNNTETTPANSCISGYVTQRELTAFGQQQHLN